MKTFLIIMASILILLILSVIVLTIMRMRKAFRLMKIRDRLDLTTKAGKAECVRLNTEINSILSWRYSMPRK